LRLLRNLGQAEVAARAGIAQAHLSRVERGVGNPTEKTLLAIAHALGATLVPVPFARCDEVERTIGLPHRPVEEAGDVFDDVFIPDPED
jgi:transcriptional regulator with XRE-family HTH domain